MARATTGVLFGGLSGKAGTVVFIRGVGGATYLRSRVKPNDPQSKRQLIVRAAMAEAARVWRELTLEEAQQWDAYTRSLERTVDSAPRKAFNVFSGLAVKFLQVQPSDQVPRTPPSEAFTGDSVVAAVSASGGTIEFSANTPNGADVTTELLLQSVGSLHSKGSPALFRSAGFFTFVPGSLSTQVSAEPGCYACAVRFVRPSTGQASGLVMLGTVRVN